MKIFEDIKDVLASTNIKWVAAHANVSESCLYNWVSGQTMYPRLDTITKVADCLGFDIKMLKKKSKVVVLKRAA